MSGDIRSTATFSIIQGGKDGADQASPDVSFASGGGGPYDPSMEARVALLERGFEELRAAVVRIEASQAELTKELREFRRDLRENDLPAMRAQLAGLEAGLREKPTGKEFLALAQLHRSV